MKVRIGFVSNSSAASFCIYGWTEEIYNTNPEFKDPDWYGNLKPIIDKLNSIPHSFGIEQSNSPNNDFVIGVGHSATKIDHGMCENEYWEDYVSDFPNEKDMLELEKLAEQLGLPKPQMYRATWFDG